MKSLSGYRVLDLTNVLSGPFCTCQLAHLGAEVIKIEVPVRGDLARQLGLDVELNQKLMGATFLAQNSGKSSITINLKLPEGVAVFKRLVVRRCRLSVVTLHIIDDAERGMGTPEFAIQLVGSLKRTLGLFRVTKYELHDAQLCHVERFV